MAINCKWEEIVRLNLTDVVPKRKSRGGRAATMAYFDGGKDNVKNIAKWEEHWNLPKRLPNKEEQAKMLATAIGIGTNVTLSIITFTHLVM